MNNELIIRKAIGDRIRSLRRSKRLTQADLAELLDCSNKYISEVERGEVNISLKKLIDLSDALDEDPGYFLTGSITDTLATKISRLSDRDKKAVEAIVDIFLEEKPSV